MSPVEDVAVWLGVGFGALAAIAAIVAAALTWIFRPRPELHLSVFATGSGGAAGPTFSIAVGNEGGKAAHGLEITARVGDEEIYRGGPIEVEAGATSRGVTAFNVPPSLGALIPACNNEVTLFGEPLVVELRDGDDVRDRAVFREPEYDPLTDAARFEAKQAFWRSVGRG